MFKDVAERVINRLTMKHLILFISSIFLLSTGHSQGPDEVERTAAKDGNITEMLADSGTLFSNDASIAEGTFDSLNFKAAENAGKADQEKESYFSAMYPNPANYVAKLDFTIDNTEENVTFVLFDLLGSKTEEIEITERSGSLTLNTSGLTEGIYFYSLLINNESVLTQKLIIKH
jgi:hypothetical protein